MQWGPMIKADGLHEKKSVRRMRVRIGRFDDFGEWGAGAACDPSEYDAPAPHPGRAHPARTPNVIFATCWKA